MIGEAYDKYDITDISSLMNAKVTAEELRKWPLVHGTLQLANDEKQAEILTTGLRADTDNLNSVDADRALGRTDYVFIAPASFRFNYGFGCGLLIDPIVLDKAGVICSEEDVSAAFECLKIALDGDGDFYCGNAVDAANLIALAERFVELYGADSDDALVRCVATEEFASYYEKHHHLAAAELYRRIEQTSRDRTLFQYFNNTGLFWGSAEIMIPQSIAPRHLLGFWNGERYIKWNEPEIPEVRLRLDAWISTLETLQGKQ